MHLVIHSTLLVRYVVLNVLITVPLFVLLISLEIVILAMLVTDLKLHQLVIILVEHAVQIALLLVPVMSMERENVIIVLPTLVLYLLLEQPKIPALLAQQVVKLALYPLYQELMLLRVIPACQGMLDKYLIQSTIVFHVQLLVLSIQYQY